MSFFPAHKLNRWQHQIHSWNHQSWWVYAFLRHFGNTSKWWKPGNHSVQKAHSHQPISAVGQPPCHIQQIQHHQLTITQGQKHLLQPTATGGRINKIQRALSTCKYPDWAINRMKLKIGTPKTSNSSNSKTTYRGHITVPYNEGLSESLKNICNRYGIQVHFKSGKTIKDELVVPKGKDYITKKSGIIYRFKCDRLESDEEYIGETARTFGERFKEHLKAPSPSMNTATPQVIPPP